MGLYLIMELHTILEAITDIDSSEKVISFLGAVLINHVFRLVKPMPHWMVMVLIICMLGFILQCVYLLQGFT